MNLEYEKKQNALQIHQLHQSNTPTAPELDRM